MVPHQQEYEMLRRVLHSSTARLSPVTILIITAVLSATAGAQSISVGGSLPGFIGAVSLPSPLGAAIAISPSSQPGAAIAVAQPGAAIQPGAASGVAPPIIDSRFTSIANPTRLECDPRVGKRRQNGSAALAWYRACVNGH